jgi:hypothetical protein
VASRTPARRSKTIHEAQAAAEGVDLPTDGKIELLGAEFKMAEKMGLAPMILLAVASRKGVDSNDPAGLVALHDVISDCIDESEHDRFWQHAVAVKADGDELMQAVKKAVEALAARPTRPPGDSSTGRQAIQGNSKGSSPKTGIVHDEMVSVDSLLGR